MTHVIPLEGRLDLAAASDLHARLLAQEGRDQCIDLTGTTHLGALGLQVLIAAGRAAREHGTVFQLQGTPEPVLAQMACMGTTPETISEGHP